MPKRIEFGDLNLRRKGEVGVDISLGNIHYCIDPGSDISGCDVILCTHTHERHCNIHELIHFSGTITSPTNIGTLVRPGVSIQLNELIVEAIEVYNKKEYYSQPIRHVKGCCVGYYIKTTGNTRLLYTGDTNLIDDLLKFKGMVDVLVLSMGYTWSMNPEEAFELVKSIRPAITIPVHFDTIKLYYKFRNMAYLYTNIIKMS
ncbi:MAG: MBL fold metallo-hydrolase [Desulfurococcaceae archaeon]